jgi:hypothetical protein
MPRFRDHEVARSQKHLKLGATARLYRFSTGCARHAHGDPVTASTTDSAHQVAHSVMNTPLS